MVIFLLFLRLLYLQSSFLQAPFSPPHFLCVAVFNGVPREFWSTLNAHPYYQWELGIVISSKLRT